MEKLNLETKAEDIRRKSFTAGGKPIEYSIDLYLDYILGDQKEAVVYAVLHYLKTLGETSLLHHFLFKSSRLNNYPFKFLASLETFKEQNQIIGFLQEEQLL